jgi:hypothetical protein
MSIRRGSSPNVTFDYYQPSSGLVTSVYNWGGTANGYSLNKDPQISSLPSAGGTNTRTVNTDPTSAADDDDDDENKMWYQCFIDTSTCPNDSAAHGMVLLFIVSAVMAFRAARGTVR